jgi:hypothetical protein
MWTLKCKKSLIFITFLVGSLFLPVCADKVLASITNGKIDSIYKYAWSNQIGWINFAPTGEAGSYSGLVITDYSVSGYAWSSKYGWINFGPFLNNSAGGVKNTPLGVLSGYAWGNNLGWINFSGVVINSTGQFTGTAIGDSVGTINFDLNNCTDCGVKTDWRPINVRGTLTSPITGGGRTLPFAAYLPPSIPASGLNVLINNGAKITSNPIVVLQFQTGSDVKRISISESPSFENAIQEEYLPTKMWILSQGDGPKTLYVKFYTQYGQASQTVSNSIVLNTQLSETRENIIPEIIKPVSQPVIKQPDKQPIEQGIVSPPLTSETKKETTESTITTSENKTTSSQNNRGFQFGSIKNFISPIIGGVKYAAQKTNAWVFEKVRLMWSFIANIKIKF